jgi:hypothetical protein
MANPKGWVSNTFNPDEVAALCALFAALDRRDLGEARDLAAGPVGRHLLARFLRMRERTRAGCAKAGRPGPWTPPGARQAPGAARRPAPLPCRAPGAPWEAPP